MAIDLGRDISATRTFRTGRFSTGPQLVAEACFRRLTTPRGALRGGEDEANYGLDLRELIGVTNLKTTAAALPGRIRAELEKDERIDSVTVDVLTDVDAAGLASFTITVEAITGEGPFVLTLLASAVTVTLLGIDAA